MIAFAGALRLLAGHQDSNTAAFDVKPRWDLTAA